MVVKVLVEMGEVFVVERRGLPPVGVFRGIFFWLPLPHYPFSSSDWSTFPFLL